MVHYSSPLESPDQQVEHLSIPHASLSASSDLQRLRLQSAARKSPTRKLKVSLNIPLRMWKGERKIYSRPSIANGSVEAIQQSTGLHLSSDSNSFARGSKAAYGHTRVQCFGIGYSLSNRMELA